MIVKCHYCAQSKPFYVKVMKLHGLTLTFENGMQATRADKTVDVCEECFYRYIWNTAKRAE